MKSSLLGLFLCLVFSSNLLAAPATIPAVKLEQFQVGNTWFWTYFEKGNMDQFYSTERYQVTEQEGTKLTFEIWTLYAGKTEFTPSAKFKMDLQGCFKAFNAPYKQGFPIEMYGAEKNGWSKVSYTIGSTAFEEKFNCNPKLYDQFVQPYKTNFKVAETKWGSLMTFQQLPRGNSSQIRAFYFQDHPMLKGIAYEKAFNPETADYFYMHLTDWKMGQVSSF